MVGLHDPARTAVRRALAGGGAITFELDRQGVLRAACGLGPGVSVAKDIRLAEMMIEKNARPAPDALADEATSLKALLRAA
jgi:3-phenylpropionate/trans-cinnamate dioxygenase ferredoxin reductase subunit